MLKNVAALAGQVAANDSNSNGLLIIVSIAVICAVIGLGIIKRHETMRQFLVGLTVIGAALALIIITLAVHNT